MSGKQKVIFCTYSCVYSSIFLKRLIDDNNIAVVAIINSTRVLHPSYGPIKGAIETIKVSGWRYSAYLFFITDLFAWMRTVLKYKKQSLKTVHELARLNQIPTFDTPDINQNESLEFIQSYHADFLIAAHFNQLIKNEILSLPAMKCLNIHPSLLPLYKGVDPVFYALLGGRDQVGVSLHRMSDSFDTGEVLLQKGRSVLSKESVFLLNCQLFSMGAELVCQWLGQNKQTIPVTITITDVVDEADCYDSWPNPQKLKVFNRLGKKLIRLSEYFSLIKSGFR